MFKKMISIVAVVGLVFALTPAVASAAISEVTPPSGGYPTSGYRLAFVTDGKIDGTSNNIATYNTFVNTQAELTTSLVKGLAVNKWYFIGSAEGDGNTILAVNAKENTGTAGAGGVPIYRLDGTKVADNNADVWDDTLDSNININQFGVTIAGTATWTGTNSDGTSGTNALGGGTDNKAERGTTNPTQGNLWTGNGWLSSETGLKPLWALSAVIPEPATMTLLVIGSIGVLMKRRRRRV